VARQKGMKIMNLSMNRSLALVGTLVFLAFATVPVLAGAIGGAKSSNEVVLARDTDTYQTRFEGGELAQVQASACHLDDDIDIYVYDENGNLIAKDIDRDGIPLCRWTPRWRGTFTIKVVNNEYEKINYRLVTN
jgi:hypothetical protein